MEQITEPESRLVPPDCSYEHQGNEMNAHGDHQGHHPGRHEYQHSFQTGAELMVVTDPANPVPGRPMTLKLMIHAPDGTMVRDFDEVHDEKVHLVIVREGLDHFAHLHPAVDVKGNLTVRHTFPVGGAYQLFADYAPPDGGHATATGALVITGETHPAPALVVNAPGDVDADGIRAAISVGPLKAEEATRVTFAVQDEQGGAAGLEDYMGSLGHLMFVSAAGKYLHVHSVAGDAPAGKVEFQAHFPQPGLYKDWGQFKRGGQVHVIPFVVDVQAVRRWSGDA